MANKIFTLEDLNNTIDRVQAATLKPPEYIFYAIQPIIDAAPEYFYQDERGQWWFETPWTCKTRTVIIPQQVNLDGAFDNTGYLIKKI